MASTQSGLSWLTSSDSGLKLQVSGGLIVRYNQFLLCCQSVGPPHHPQPLCLVPLTVRLAVAVDLAEVNTVVVGVLNERRY